MSLDGRAENDPALFWEKIQAGERLVRNVGKRVVGDDGRPSTESGGTPPADELHFLNLSATVAATLWVETDQEPIVDFRAYASTTLLGAVRVQDGAGGQLAEVGSLANADNNAPGYPALLSNAYNFLFNATSVGFDRFRSASAASLIAQSGLGVALTVPPGEWDVPSVPASGAQASASRAAGGAGVRHIGRRVSFGFSSSAALAGATSVTFNLRDGATAAGVILKSWIFALPAAIIVPFAVSFEIDSVGSAATAMTLETFAAVGGLQVFANLSGYDAQ
jgi:hypothetical protein